MGEHGPRMAIQDRLDVLLAMFAPHEKGVRYENVLFILTILPVDRQDGTLGQLAARADELARKPFVTSKELFRLINSMRRLF